MDSLSQQVLLVVDDFVNNVEEGSIDDVDIWCHGRRLYGNSWGGPRKTSVVYGWEYCPAISMSLGRLAQAGYVEKVDLTTWDITAEGREWCQTSMPMTA